MRRVGSAILIAVSLALLGASSAPAADITLLPKGTETVEDKGQVLTRDLGENRGAQTIPLLFFSTSPLERPPSVTLFDTHSDDDVPFGGTVTATAELAGERVIKVPVVIDPADDDRGSFETRVLLTSKQTKPKAVVLRVELSRSPSEGCAWFWAILALGLGLALGGFLHWLANSASKLRTLLSQYEMLISALPATSDLRPPELLRKLAEIRANLSTGDAAGAEEKLKDLKTKAPATLKALDGLVELETRLARQSAMVHAMADAPTDQLLRAVQHERDLLEAQAAGTYPDPAGGEADRVKVALWISQYENFLADFADPAGRPERGPALTQYALGDFEAARNLWPQPAGAATGAAGGAAEDAAPEAIEPIDWQAVGGGGWFARTKWAAIRNASTLAGLLIGMAFVIVGLESVFNVDTMFMENDVEDFLTLLAWGFGSAVVGLTTTELGAKLKPPAAS